MHRFGLVDFWYYNNEEFYFGDGHMLLRGSNGSGKSVTLQSCIPLLLDGNRSSERIDTFGSRARKMDTYLIDEDSEREDRIGYLYLEFKKEEQDRYITIGMGLHARKNKPLDTWYFVIEDNKRTNQDVFLIKNNLTLTKRELRFCLGDQVIEQQRAYMEKVNQVLFGFDTMEEYREAITLLLQIRQPKLGSDFKPTMLNEVLNQSLQPLSEDDLRPMSEAIANMDAIKDDLDMLKMNIQACETIAKEYRKYNYYMVYDKLDKYQREEKKLKQYQQVVKEKEAYIITLQGKQQETSKHLDEIERESAILLSERVSLANDDVRAKQEQLHRLLEQQSLLQQSLVKKGEKLEQLESKWLDDKKQVKRQKDKQSEKQEACTELLASMQELSEDIHFHEHEAMQREVKQAMQTEYNYSYIRRQLSEKLQVCDRGVQASYQLSTYDGQLKVMQDDYQILLETKEKKEYDLTNAIKQYQEMVDAYKEQYVVWNQENNVLKLNKEEIQGLFQYVIQYEDKQNYQVIQQIINDKRFQKQDGLDSLRREKQQDIRSVQRQIETLSRELLKWENQGEVAPLLREDSLKNRAILKDKHIDFIPFYTLIEFNDSVAQKVKNQMEEMLAKSGMLDAIVVHEKYRDILVQQEEGADAYLFTSVDVRDIKPVLMENTTSIEKIMSQLHIEAKSVFTWSRNYYMYGYIEATLSGEEKAKYVGANEREAYRQKMILDLKKELDERREEYRNDKEILDCILYDIECLRKEYESFPGEEKLYEAFHVVKEAEQVLENITKTSLQSKQNILDLKIKMKPVLMQMEQCATQLEVESKQHIFEQLKQNLQGYQMQLSALYEVHMEYRSIYQLLEIMQENLLNMEVQIDELKYDQHQQSKRLEDNVSEITMLKQSLEALGIAHIEKRLEEISSRLDEIKELEKQYREQLGKVKEAYEVARDSIESEQEQVAGQEGIREQYEVILNQEIAYGFYQETLNIKELLEMKAEDHDKVMQQGRKVDLQGVFHANNANLQEYALSIRMVDTNAKVEDVGNRLLIEAKLSGNQVNLFALVDSLEAMRQQQEDILKESDRSLFEDILINTISKKVRTKIRQSRNWVAKMNEYMDAMNTSSSLKLNLVWQANKADGDEQLHVSELVQLLERDATLLKQSDLERISKHFRSKIQAARYMLGREENTFSFHMIMKDVMDYRQWFSFTIMYQMGNMSKRELTNHRFATFSGGEKAMAMYIPMFSAVAAKFANGKSDAPSIIALDEAFAGVDENNIDTMFALIEKFEFDYLMNSQALWGDYPAVKALSIYELHRPQDAPFVSVLHYYWNGKVKEYLAG